MRREGEGYEPANGREDHGLIEAVREVWLRYGGLNPVGMERELRAAGWRFTRNRLYTRRERYRGGHRTIVGWPERFGWEAELTEEQRRRGGRKRRFPGWTELEVRSDFAAWLAEEQAAGGAMRWDWAYQRYVMERLRRVALGECKRLMSFMPPRHGKSEMVTVRFTAWSLLCQPRLNVIIGSYNQRLANRFSKRIRRIVDEVGSSGGHGKPPATAGGTDRSGAAVSNRARSVAEWETSGGGLVRAVGVGGGIAGFGAGLVVVDDPVRSRADAESERRRDAVDDWFKNDIYTRLDPGGAIILIQTRWHEDDLAGRLLKEMEDGGERWEVVRLPALAEPPLVSGGLAKPSVDGEGAPGLTDACGNPSLTSDGSDPLGRSPGEPLCPERYGRGWLEAARGKLGGYAFEALYQQNPSPAEGGRFKRDWFRKVVDHAPAGLRWKRGYDLAVSTKASADYTASFRVAMDAEGNLYIADGFRARIEYPEQRRYIVERMTAEAADTEHGIEAAMHGKAVVQELRRDTSLRRYAFREVRVAGDKLTRALAWLNLAEAGKVFLVRGAWIDAFVEEVAAFPTGRHDDQVDAVSTAVNMLVGAARGKRARGF